MYPEKCRFLSVRYDSRENYSGISQNKSIEHVLYPPDKIRESARCR